MTKYIQFLVLVGALAACGSDSNQGSNDAGVGEDANGLQPGSLGTPCEANTDCDSAHCFDTGTAVSGICSDCDADSCAAGQSCLMQERHAVCRGGSELGEPCSEASTCLSTFCSGEICALCETDDDCFLGLSCVVKEPEGYSLCLDPTEERVNADASEDGSFERVGCNANCNGCVCDQDADGHADGFCVEQDCIAPSVVEPSPTVVLTCGVDGCAPEDRDQPAATTCTGNSGLSCANFGEVSDSQSFFEQQGLCICFGGGFCQCQAMASGGGGDVTCQENGVVVHETACSGAAVPCDDSYTGDFDPDFGTFDASSGLCAPAVCTPEEERVDINQNNNFDQCGCAYNSQGVLCRVGPSGSEQLGLCAGRDCVLAAPVSRYCNRESCESEVEIGCAYPGYACDNSLIQPGQQSFNAEGYCAEVAGVLECVTTGHVCRADSGSGQFFGDCGVCGEDAPCDDTLGDGAFDSSFGTCQSGACVANVIPNRFSWRDHQGQDWTTPVANQQTIGACTAFGVIASIEAKWNIQNNTHDLNLNLSEQQAVSCGGYTAAGGGSVTLDYAVVDGFSDEACLPWANSSTLTCELCADAEDRLWKITGFRGVTPYRNEFKVRIMRDGPVVAHVNAGGMTPGPTGVYYCPTNQGGHVVSVVGWDDVGGYWIIKNSWGPAWDGDGFFNLRYDECGLVPKYTIDSVVAP